MGHVPLWRLIVIYLALTDIVIFRLIHRYSYLPIGFHGRAHRPLLQLSATAWMFSEQPNKFLNRPKKQRTQPNANCRIYEPGFRGDRPQGPCFDRLRSRLDCGMP